MKTSTQTAKHPHAGNHPPRPKDCGADQTDGQDGIGGGMSDDRNNVQTGTGGPNG